MYRLGVGDCFLVSFPKADGGRFFMLIDCGVHQSQKGGADLVRKVVANMAEETGGRLDIVVGTHEHWDHISGFSQAEEQFAGFSAEEIWFAWTEDDRDPLARELAGKRRRALAALTSAQARMRLMGLEDAHARLSSLLGFFGDGAGKKLGEAGRVLKSLSSQIRYRRPGEPPIELPGVEARIFVLGPPRSAELIKRDAPSKTGSEVYEFGAYSPALDAIEPALNGDFNAPFDDRYALPLEGSKSLPFFQRYYWQAHSPAVSRGEDEETDQAWRRIDSDWMGAAEALALKLDEDTNNTSLVLAIELGPPHTDGPVILFAADAQVGSWLSWQDVVWEDYHGRRITGPDLLCRTHIYKVGHHASHNATLRELGLEMMEALELALVPTDDKMAEKVGWGTLPWPPLLERLDEKTDRRVIRTDRALPAKLEGFAVSKHELYYQIEW
jgi:hypothetical protein